MPMNEGYASDDYNVEAAVRRTGVGWAMELLEVAVAHADKVASTLPDLLDERLAVVLRPEIVAGVIGENRGSDPAPPISDLTARITGLAAALQAATHRIEARLESTIERIDL